LVDQNCHRRSALNLHCLTKDYFAPCNAAWIRRGRVVKAEIEKENGIGKRFGAVL
jgi:hypothetical protein